MHAGLLRLIAEVAAAPGGVVWATDEAARVWWELETRLRADLAEPVSLQRMVELTGRSVATIARSCRRATGLTPMRRVKAVRLSLARGLVQSSPLSLTAIAGRVGYPRLHEFSRDYRRQFGHPPSADRGS